MGLPEDLPAHARLTERAQRDLEDLLKKDPKNFHRVWEDLKRLAKGALPQRPKKLKGFAPPIWQLDSGDFRIFFTPAEEALWIRGVLSKPKQKKRLRTMR